MTQGFKYSNNNFPVMPKDNKCPRCGVIVSWLGWVILAGSLMCKECKTQELSIRESC